MSATGHDGHTGGTATPGDTLAPPGRRDVAWVNPIPLDERVADDFFKWPRHQSQESMHSPRFVGLLYGLLCADLRGREVLLPNPHGLVHDAVHVARIWFKTTNVRMNAEVPRNATGRDASSAYTYFDLAGSSVVFTALDKAGKPLRDPSAPLKKRNNPYHPWLDYKWIRCLKKLTGLPLIGNKDRENPDLVAARIRLATGTVCAFPPFSRDGQHGLWQVKQRGKKVVSATTDSMLWSRPLMKQTAAIRMTVRSLNREAGWHVDLVPDSGTVLLCVVTHAMLPINEEQRPDGRKLTHSRAFAKLLKGGARLRFPVPEIVSLPRPYGVQSSDDVHCECTSCP